MRPFAWSDLILDHSRKLVGLQSPAACATRAGGDSGPNFENCYLFHAQSPPARQVPVFGGAVVAGYIIVASMEILKVSGQLGSTF